LLKLFINKQQNKFYQNFNQGSNQEQERKTGEVNIKGNRKKSHNSDSLGDYVDYEDVSENEK
jgi:hypothetical protein